MSSSVLSSTAYSSDVRSATVWIRQCAASSPSRNTPEHGVRVADIDGEQHGHRSALDGSSPSSGRSRLGSTYAPTLDSSSRSDSSRCSRPAAARRTRRPGRSQATSTTCSSRDIPLDQKQSVVQTQNDWSVAKMENAKAEADFNEANAQLDRGRTITRAPGSRSTPRSRTRRAPRPSADNNRINAGAEGAARRRAAAEGRRRAREVLRGVPRLAQAPLALHAGEHVLARGAVRAREGVSSRRRTTSRPKGVNYDCSRSRRPSAASARRARRPRPTARSARPPARAMRGCKQQDDGGQGERPPERAPRSDGAQGHGGRDPGVCARGVRAAGGGQHPGSGPPGACRVST